MTTQEICVNIDRSGSMHGKESDTVGGINAMLDELRRGKNVQNRQLATWLTAEEYMQKTLLNESYYLLKDISAVDSEREW